MKKSRKNNIVPSGIKRSYTAYLRNRQKLKDNGIALGKKLSIAAYKDAYTLIKQFNTNLDRVASVLAKEQQLVSNVQARAWARLIAAKNPRISAGVAYKRFLANSRWAKNIFNQIEKIELNPNINSTLSEAQRKFKLFFYVDYKE